MARSPAAYFKPRRIRRRFVVGLYRFGRNDHTRLLIIAVVVGAAAAAGAVAFWRLFDFIRAATFGTAGESVLVTLDTVPWWLIVLVPAAGGLLIGLFVQFVMPGRRPLAVADTIEAVSLRDGRMSLTHGVAAALVSAASIGVGASVGREGPIVHLGATLGSWIATRLRLHRQLVQTLLGCGAAGAVAASFNAPIAGAFFALEVVLGHYVIKSFAPVVIASVTGTLVYRLHLGNTPAFVKPEYAIASFWEFPAFALLGVVSAIAALVFMWAVVAAQEKAEALPVPPWLRPAGAGFVVGLMALVLPQILGVGYAMTNQVLNQGVALWLLIALIPAKIVATAICLGAGFGGGVFSPALFIGAMTGGAFGIVASGVFPDLSSGHGAYALVGMGAVAAAVLNAPMSTILIIFELTGDYAITIAVMVAVVIANVITYQVAGGSIFSGQLRLRGVNVDVGRETRVLRRIKAGGAVMDRNFRTVRPDSGLAAVRPLLQHAPHGELFVVDPEGRLVGTVAFQDLREAAFDLARDEDLAAVDIMRRDPPFLLAEDGLDRALAILETQDEPHIPVVDGAETMKLIGLVHERDVVLAMNRAIAESDDRGRS